MAFATLALSHVLVLGYWGGAGCLPGSWGPDGLSQVLAGSSGAGGLPWLLEMTARFISSWDAGPGSCHSLVQLQPSATLLWCVQGASGSW